MVPEQQALIRSSLPMFRRDGETIVGLFYEDVFQSDPNLVHRFSMEDQVSGLQAKRFTHVLIAYVESLSEDDGTVRMDPSFVAATRAHFKKNVEPNEFADLRTHFLKAIEIFMRGTAPPALIEAWGVAYDDLAAIMMAAQREGPR